jgi:hypothetical protein
VEGVFGDEGEASACGLSASRRANGGAVQGVRDLPRDGYKIFDRYGLTAHMKTRPFAPITEGRPYQSAIKSSGKPDVVGECLPRRVGRLRWAEIAECECIGWWP